MLQFPIPLHYIKELHPCQMLSALPLISVWKTQSGMPRKESQRRENEIRLQYQYHSQYAGGGDIVSL